jgi:hypothetical protein
MKTIMKAILSAFILFVLTGIAGRRSRQRLVADQPEPLLRFSVLATHPGRKDGCFSQVVHSPQGCFFRALLPG